MGILDELKNNIPARFADMTPHHFEELICELFVDSGYEVRITKSTGDFGADIILTKDKLKTAVEVKKYQRVNLVGVKEINQVIGGREYYKCDKAILVTTSDFTKAARKLAEQTGVELWNWDKLYSRIKETYLRGQDVYDFFARKTVSPVQNQGETPKVFGYKEFVFQIEKIRENMSITPEKGRQGGSISTVIHIKMTNTTNEKIYITVRTPIIITTLGNQLEAYSAFVGGFTEGYIYPQASVPIIFCWYSDQIPKGKLIKSIIVRYSGVNEEVKEEFVYRDSSAKIIDEGRFKSRCFIATAVYGTSLAPEIDILTDFRDKFFLKNKLGKEFVGFYYQFSPPIAGFISKHLLLRKILRETIIRPTTKAMKFLNM